jgi:AcrR family transcriptional regulator
LVYRYFGGGKEELYAEVVRLSLADLVERETNALAHVAKHTPARERIRLLLAAYLDHIAANPTAWAMPRRQPGSEPAATAQIRAAAERDRVALLRSILAPNAQPRHEYALWGFFGFVDAACLNWVADGARAGDRWPLIDAALGALEGALGDWSA